MNAFVVVDVVVSITLSYGNPDRRCKNKKKTKKNKEQRSKAKRGRKVRLMRYFSIITAAVVSLTTLPVFDGITVYHAIVSSHYMPSCGDYCVLVAMNGVK